MLMTRFIWQTVLKPLSVTDAKNGANTPSLIPTMEAGHYSIQVGAVNMERYNQFIEASGLSIRGFPFSPLMSTFVFSSKHKGAEYRSLVVGIQYSVGMINCSQKNLLFFNSNF